MQINLAGFNLDFDTIRDLKESSNWQKENITPETLAAAYARISRYDLPVDQLRAVARDEVSKARKSNQKIIFDMGHHSVAEHAVFNFDMIGVSRLAIEEIEKFRLCSYTEKSQRYIKLKDDFVIPAELEEIKDNSLKHKFIETVTGQHSAYHQLFTAIKNHLSLENPHLLESKIGKIELAGMAKEDARYITSLAVEGQLGATINARNLELIIRRFACHPLQEVRQVGKQLCTLVSQVAPSIILSVDKSLYDQNMYQDFHRELGEILEPSSGQVIENSEMFKQTLNQTLSSIDQSEAEVKLLNYTPEADLKVLSALAHKVGNFDYQQIAARVTNLEENQRCRLFLSLFGHLEFFDTMPRELEHVNLTFELKVSASCFAQLKRHRLATLTVQDYHPNLGITIPESVVASGQEDFFLQTIAATQETYWQIKKELPGVAPYILTNAHRRRVLFTLNAREMYHFCRLRQDRHAQWDIRLIADQMAKQAREKMPITFCLLCGKDGFEKLKKKVSTV